MLPILWIVLWDGALTTSISMFVLAKTVMREETSEEMLDLIGLQSDKSVGKPNSCQLPSGSKEA